MATEFSNQITAEDLEKFAKSPDNFKRVLDLGQDEALIDIYLPSSMDILLRHKDQNRPYARVQVSIGRTFVFTEHSEPETQTVLAQANAVLQHLATPST